MCLTLCWTQINETKSEMKKKLQQTPQKHESHEITSEQLYANKMDNLEEINRYLQCTISQD